jgi:hypothetical protein
MTLQIITALIKVNNEKTTNSSQKYSKWGIIWKKYVVKAPNKS